MDNQSPLKGLRRNPMALVGLFMLLLALFVSVFPMTPMQSCVSILWTSISRLLLSICSAQMMQAKMF
jgi:hypothetical protein